MDAAPRRACGQPGQPGGIGLAWPCQLLSSTEPGLFGIAIFFASESKLSAPFLLFSRVEVVVGGVLYVESRKNKHAF